MESLFTIGQTVVAIKDHSQGDFKKGQQFTILAIKSFCCYVGVKITSPPTANCITYCTDCRIEHGGLDGFYYDQVAFAPLHEIGDMTFEDAIELVTPKILEII
jgi:hypothetical protein